MNGDVIIDEEKTPSLSAQNLGNGAMMPDPDTVIEAPWAGKELPFLEGQVLCETKWLGNGLPQEMCPRYMARKQLDFLAGLGYHLYSGFEVEMMLMSGGERNPAFEQYKNFCYDGMWNNFKEVVLTVDQSLQKMGVHSQALQLEYGKGQIECALSPSYGIKAADDVFHMRNAWKTIVPQMRPEMEVTFMSRPYPKNIGNGLHFGQSLRFISSDTNAMSDTSDPDRISSVARHWIGGLVKHATALVALTSPTYNCYRRLCTPWVPSKADWGIEDRTCAFRVCRTSPQTTYVECRLPSGSANPYLVMAGIVAAGIDGIVNKIEPPPQSDPGAATVPRTLERALDELEKDAALMKALGSEFVSWFRFVKEHELTLLGGQYDIYEDVEEMGDKEYELYKIL